MAWPLVVAFNAVWLGIGCVEAWGNDDASLPFKLGLTLLYVGFLAFLVPITVSQLFHLVPFNDAPSGDTGVYCRTCGYDLHGLAEPSPRCPECGEAFSYDDDATFLNHNGLRQSNYRRRFGWWFRTMLQVLTLGFFLTVTAYAIDHWLADYVAVIVRPIAMTVWGALAIFMVARAIDSDTEVPQRE